jgi:hypothetical protein
VSARKPARSSTNAKGSTMSKCLKSTCIFISSLLVGTGLILRGMYKEYCSCKRRLIGLVFWDSTPCRIVCWHGRYGGTCCLKNVGVKVHSYRISKTIILKVPSTGVWNLFIILCFIKYSSKIHSCRSVLLRRLRILAKSANNFVPLSVRLFACISAAPTGGICAKFYIGNFYGILSRYSKFS